ncbi:MAG: glucose dehydrogenase [Litorilinea sp.]|nr:MAG: glucose dehydrogenase [Litorilinea sp.]
MKQWRWAWGWPGAGRRKCVLLGWLALMALSLLGLHPTHLSAQDTNTLPLVWPELTLTRIVGEYDQPVHVTHAGDGSGRLFVVERAGVIRVVQGETLLPDPFLDIRDRVNSNCGECGLLGLAFPPDFATGGYFFVHYSAVGNPVSPDAPSEPDPGTGNDTVVARFRITGDGNVADPDSEERILLVNQPYTNHNGGHLTFGPDGYLYVGLGDGGSGGDPFNAGQRTDTLLGKILRIQVGATGSYTIPTDNPFAQVAGSRDEIWAYGLRNPWRFNFDRLTGDLYIADVGQGSYEEVNFQPAASSGGENYGWRIMEGMHCYGSPTCDQTGLTLPVAEYDHSRGDCSITGGMVYRGFLTRLQGIYLYGDFCTGRIWGLQRDGSGWAVQELADTRLRISSFGEDEAGNVFVVDMDGGIYLVGDAGHTWPHALFLPSVRRP